MKSEAKRVSVLDALVSKSEKEAAQLLLSDYEITELDAVNLVSLARMGKTQVLQLALARLKPREQAANDAL